MTFLVPFAFHGFKVTPWEPPQPSAIATQRKDRSIGRQGQLSVSQSGLEAWGTWKDGFDVPRHHSIEEGVKQHHGQCGGEIKAIFLHRALKEIVPLHPYALLLKKGKVFTAKSKSHGRQKTLRGRVTVKGLSPRLSHFSLLK